MRLICPHCMSGVTVSDDTAGKDAVCPNCGKSFPTPPRYAPTVAAEAAVASGVIDPVRPASPQPAPSPHAPSPPAPPGFVPPSPPPVAISGFLPPASASAEVAPPTGYTKSFGITISPRVVAWLPAILLTVVFVLSFFPWVGCYTGSSAVYSQRPWGAMLGLSPNTNHQLEEAGTIPGGWIDKMRSDWRLLVPFFLLLSVAIVFAWTERGFSTLDPRKIPPLAKFWPWHNVIVAGCASLAFLFLVLQVWNGFSMERAIKQQIAEQFADRREKAKESPATQARLDYQEERAFDAYNVERTSWLYLALACSLSAVIAVGTRACLDRRGNKPPPKILLHY